LFAAIAECAATLSGLLFVAMTVSLFGLVPGHNAGYPLHRRLDEAAVR